MHTALDIHVKGIVQGVGFRPFVYRLARKYKLFGWVLNARDGVHIHAEGEEKSLDSFVFEISEHAPSAAQVKEITLSEAAVEGMSDFEILQSEEDATDKVTLVSPDLGICDACVKELFDPADRRYRYPFINCTNCGPRFTIIEGLPYDRANTSMARFELCADCEAEYKNPGDRRFHAQPNACFDCGPHISFWYASTETPDAFAQKTWGITREESDAILSESVDLLESGKILGLKGLGGFHLVCDAKNEKALTVLRERKRRPRQPFAVMVPDVAAAQKYCEVNDIEASQLKSPARPIVLLKKKESCALAPGLADDLPELGVMLPATGLQCLLMHDFKERGNEPLLVMTSGNVHDEPIACDDEDAAHRLSAIADAFIGNDREIRTRFDDSVVRVIKVGQAGFAVQTIRRARGYAPTPLVLEPLDKNEDIENSPESLERNTASIQDGSSQADKADAVTTFATGAEQKNTMTFLRGSEAFVSQHIGDMECVETFDMWSQTKAQFENLFHLHPQEIICDMHPSYLTTTWAKKQDLKLTQVQHHHAHIASVLGECKIDEAVCGIAFDGTGYGSDGQVWGGEVLLANRSDFERFANFAYLPMPGGAAAIKEPLRMAYGALWTFDLLDHPGAQRSLKALGESVDTLQSMIDEGINTPMTSSVGRLFDAAAALLGVVSEASYEGEPAILLEAAMGSWWNRAPEPFDERYKIALEKNVATKESTAHDTSVLLFDAAPTFTAMLDDLEAGVATSLIARRFHDAFVDLIKTAAELISAVYQINTIALSGGVFMNRYIIENAVQALESEGFTVAINQELPPNDGNISYGQAVVASARKDTD